MEGEAMTTDQQTTNQQLEELIFTTGVMGSHDEAQPQTITIQQPSGEIQVLSMEDGLQDGHMIQIQQEVSDKSMFVSEDGETVKIESEVQVVDSKNRIVSLEIPMEISDQQVLEQYSTVQNFIQ